MSSKYPGLIDHNNMDKPNIEVRFFHKHDRDLVGIMGKCGPKMRINFLKTRSFRHEKEIADLKNPAIDLGDDDINPTNVEEIPKLPCGCDFNQLQTIADTVNRSAGRTAFLNSNRTSVDHLTELIEKTQLVVATVKDPKHPKNGQIIGCILTLPHSEDHTDPTVQYSGMFSVREDFQGQGIARKLTEFVLRDAIHHKKRCLQFTVWAPTDGLPHPQSERLCSMYERGGAKRVDEKSLVECYPHYEPYLKRPCKVIFYEIDLESFKKEMFIKMLKAHTSKYNIFKKLKSSTE